MTEIRLIWGCDRSRQLELDWLRSLFHPFQMHEQDAEDPPFPDLCSRVLVESGLLRLESNVSLERLDEQHRLRHRLG